LFFLHVNTPKITNAVGRPALTRSIAESIWWDKTCNWSNDNTLPCISFCFSLQ